MNVHITQGNLSTWLLCKVNWRRWALKSHLFGEVSPLWVIDIISLISNSAMLFSALYPRYCDRCWGDKMIKTTASVFGAYSSMEKLITFIYIVVQVIITWCPYIRPCSCNDKQSRHGFYLHGAYSLVRGTDHWNGG